MSSYGYTYDDKVKPRFNEISMWVRDGLSEREIAKKLGVSYSRFRDFKKQESALSALLKNSVLTNVNADVENALLKRALGYTVTEITREPIKDRKTGLTYLAVTKEVTKEIQGDLGAQKMWLTNRSKNKWCENPHNHDIKKAELELRKTEIENRSW